MFGRKKGGVSAAVASASGRAARSPREASSWFLLGAIICAVLAGMLAVSFVRAAAPSVTVYAARADLVPGQAITEGDLVPKTVPASAAPRDRVRSPGEVAGKHARTFVAAGDVLRAAHVVELNSGALAARLALESDPRLRAVALPKEAAQGLKAEPGDRVDVYAFVPVQGAAPEAGTLVAAAAPVLAAAERNKDTGQETGLVVAVPPEAAAKIAMVLGVNGKLLAVLAPPGTQR